jgi:hypothetical protein
LDQRKSEKQRRINKWCNHGYTNYDKKEGKKIVFPYLGQNYITVTDMKNEDKEKLIHLITTNIE